MGIAAADYSLDGREDLFVTNSRKQLHAVYRTTPRAFVDARPDFVDALGGDYTGWGVSWVDLDLDGNLDLVLANGAIPLLHPRKDAQRLQVLENLTGEGHRGEFADAGAAVGLPPDSVSTAAASPPPTTTTTATSTWRSTRSPDRCSCSETAARVATGSR